MTTEVEGDGEYGWFACPQCCELFEYDDELDEHMNDNRSHMSRIDSHLYVGAAWNASRLAELKCSNVGCVISVAEEMPTPLIALPPPIRFIHYPLYDNLHEFLLPKAIRAAYDIKHQHDNGVVTLIHCAQGKSRSVSVAVLYCMIQFQWTYEEALRHLVSKRQVAHPNINYAEQLTALNPLRKLEWNGFVHIAEYLGL